MGLWRIDLTGFRARLESDAIRKDWFSSNLFSAIYGRFRERFAN